MNKKQIINFLKDLAIVVQEKQKYEEKQVELLKQKLVEGAVTGEESKKNFDLLQYFKSSLTYTSGQLYEINYILETITRKK